MKVVDLRSLASSGSGDHGDAVTWENSRPQRSDGYRVTRPRLEVVRTKARAPEWPTEDLVEANVNSDSHHRVQRLMPRIQLHPEAPRSKPPQLRPRTSYLSRKKQPRVGS